jgi:hypothetical protein
MAMGQIPENFNEGSLIWSSNASGANCLSAFIRDQFLNPVMQCQNVFDLRAAMANGSYYQLFGPSQGISDCKGGLMWCTTRVTRSNVIELRISSPFFTKTIASSIQVTGQGAAVNIIVVSPIANKEAPFPAGSSIPPVQIQIANGARMPLYQTSSIFLRIRVRQKNSTLARFVFGLSLIISMWYAHFSPPVLDVLDRC